MYGFNLPVSMCESLTTRLLSFSITSRKTQDCFHFSSDVPLEFGRQVSRHEVGRALLHFISQSCLHCSNSLDLCSWEKTADEEQKFQTSVMSMLRSLRNVHMCRYVVSRKHDRASWMDMVVLKLMFYLNTSRRQKLSNHAWIHQVDHAASYLCSMKSHKLCQILIGSGLVWKDKAHLGNVSLPNIRWPGTHGVLNDPLFLQAFSPFFSLQKEV